MVNPAGKPAYTRPMQRETAAAPSFTVGAITIAMTLLGWSSVPLFLRYFSDHIDVWTSNGWRYGFAALVWLPLILIYAGRRKLPQGLFRRALVPSVINAVGQVVFVAAHYQIDPGLLTFGLRIQLLFAAVGAYLLFAGERPIIRSKGYIVGAIILALGTSGAILFDDDPIRGGHAYGIGLAILSGFLFASYGLSVRKYMFGINSAVAFAAISQYTAGAMLVLMFILGENAGAAALEMAPDQLFWLLASAVIGIALGHVFYYLSMARLGVAVSAGVLQLQPFFVGIASYLVFDERLTGAQWISGTIAVCGAGLMLAVQRVISRRRHIDTREVAIAEGESGS